MHIVQSDESFFSPREKEILHHLLRDKTVKEISQAISVASHAIEHHIESILVKVKLTSTSPFVTALVNQFSRIGWEFSAA